MVPVVVQVALLAEQVVLTDGGCYRLVLIDLLIDHLQLDLTLIVTHFQSVRYREEGCLLCVVLLAAAEPHLDSKVVSLRRVEGGDVNRHVMVFVQMSRQVLVVDIPAFALHVHVARTGHIGHHGAVSLVHAPVTHQSRCVGSPCLVARLI